MDKAELRLLEKMTDNYFEGKTELQVYEDTMKAGYQISDNILDELESEENGYVVKQIIRKIPPKRGNKGFVNHKAHKGF